MANQDFEKAASLRDQADKLRKKKEAITREWREKSRETDGVVDEDVIAETVSKITGVPMTRLEKGEAHNRGRYFQFFQAVQAAEVQSEMTAMAVWRRGMSDDWRAAKELLTQIAVRHAALTSEARAMIETAREESLFVRAEAESMQVRPAKGNRDCRTQQRDNPSQNRAKSRPVVIACRCGRRARGSRGFPAQGRKQQRTG